MKNIIIALIFAASLLVSAYILNRTFHDNVLINRINMVERDMEVLQVRYDASYDDARKVIDEVKKIVEGAYTKVIPISGGLLAIKEE